jgi:hypothetical protein
MIAVLSYPAAIREPNVCSLQNGRIDIAFLGATIPQRNPERVATIRNEDGSVAGFVGYADGQLKMPPAWIRTNVVKLKRA